MNGCGAIADGLKNCVPFQWSLCSRIDLLEPSWIGPPRERQNSAARHGRGCRKTGRRVARGYAARECEPLVPDTGRGKKR